MKVVEMGQKLLFLALGLVSLLAIGACSSGGDGGGGGGTPPVAQTGTVSGQVASAANGSAVAGATVSTSAGTSTTAVNGTFTVPAPVGDRSVVHVEATGFAEAFPVSRVTAGQTTILGVRLLPTAVSTLVTVATGGIVTDPNSTAQVDIPADGLVPKNGGAVVGTVTVSLTPINPAVDTNLMPGDFTGVSAGGGSPVPIESFGALLIDIRDSAGTRYTLAPNKTSTIRIPLGTKSLVPPATIPLYFFDETTGLWKEEGTATRQGTAPNQYYEGTVTHFSFWNADQVLDTVFVTGCVRDANNQPVAGLIVQSNGIDYTGSAYSSIAADGTFRVAMRRNSRATFGLFEFDLQTFTVTPVSNLVNGGPSPVDFTLPNCLVMAPGPLTITTSALPGGNVGASYNQTLVATGGIPGYVWSLDGGSNPLPAGLTLNPSGVISGTPTTAETTTITVKVTDSASGTVTKELSLTISPPGVVPVTITSLSPLPAGIVGTVYGTTLAVSGGTGTLSWSVISGALPVGVTLNPATGQVSGTPTTQATSTFTILVQDTGTPQQSNQKQFSLTINAASSGGGGGTLTVTNAPASVGGTFVADGSVTVQVVQGTTVVVAWGEISSVNVGHSETLSGAFDSTTGQISQFGTLTFVMADSSVGIGWTCSGAVLPGITTCSGVTMDRIAGTVNFASTVLQDIVNSTPPITLNGTLSFTPF